MTNLALKECGLFLDVKSAEEVVRLSLISALGGDTNFRCGRGLEASYIEDSSEPKLADMMNKDENSVHSVLSHLRHFDVV